MNTGSTEHLRLLALVARTGTLAGAAGELGITPGAVTQRLARAERDWGATLVLRGPRGARLTDAGAVLAAYGEIVDRQVHAATDAFDAFRGHTSQRLRIGAFQAAALHLLPPALTALRHRHPCADLSVVDVTSADAVGALATGELDLVVHATFGAPPAVAPGIVTVELMRDPLIVVLPDDHPLAADDGPVRLRQLGDETWVLIHAGHLAREQFDRAAAQTGFIPHVRFETGSYDVAQALVGAGIGVALVSRLAWTNVPGTVARPLTRPALHRDIHVSTQADARGVPLAATFTGLLRDVVRDLAL